MKFSTLVRIHDLLVQDLDALAEAMDDARKAYDECEDTNMASALLTTYRGIRDEYRIAKSDLEDFENHDWN